MYGHSLPIGNLKGVGEKKALLLKKLGIETVQDMLFFYPRSYKDFSVFSKLDSIHVGEEYAFVLTLQSDAKTSFIRKNFNITQMLASDDTGFVTIIFYNQPYRKEAYKMGKTYAVYGKIEKFGHKLRIVNPIMEAYREGMEPKGIMPIYPLTGGLTQKNMIEIIGKCLYLANSQIKEELPNEFRKKFSLCEINYALQNLHFPKSEFALKEAKNRLIFEELFMFMLALYYLREKRKEKEGIVFDIKEDYIKEFKALLPFELTDAQENAANEIVNDMKSNCQMERLLEGDVGSGKTVVAAMAMFLAAKCSYQSALMVPTEVLAIQHFENISELLRQSNIKCGLLKGKMTAKEKREALYNIEKGIWDIVIGTHALIQEAVVFKNLGLVITDEQHRFSVNQRGSIKEKGQNPDVLVMSATPIPRTLALTLYGDLDISIIDTMPKGRKKVQTFYVPKYKRNDMYAFLRKQIGEGRQAYIVCPSIEEVEGSTLKSVNEVFNELKKNQLSGLKIELMHGKLSSKKKDEIIKKFCDGEIDVLVSTTVIEVGINIVNASVMIIEGAERFGLAQLHQLRGRVGRGSYESYCFLIDNSDTSEIRARLEIITKESSGFEIAKKDLEIRGPGKLLGDSQHGLGNFYLADLINDVNMLKKAQSAAEDFIKNIKTIDYAQDILDIMNERLGEKFKKLNLN